MCTRKSLKISLLEIFATLDKNNDGILKKYELDFTLKRLNLPKLDVSFASLDLNDDGFIDYRGE